MNVNTMHYHGVREQVRRVLTAMGPERVSVGLTAFETGHSSWSACFFARAYPELKLDYCGDPEGVIAQALGMPGNKVPMRITYTLFDGAGKKADLGREGLLKFVNAFLDENRDPETQNAINDLIAGIDLSAASMTNQPMFDQSCGIAVAG